MVGGLCNPWACAARRPNLRKLRPTGAHPGYPLRGYAGLDRVWATTNGLC